MKKIVVRLILIAMAMATLLMGLLLYERPPLIPTSKPAITYTVDGKTYSDARTWVPLCRSKALFIKLPHAANHFDHDRSMGFVIDDKRNDVYRGSGQPYPLLGWPFFNPDMPIGIDILFKGKME